MTEQWLCSYKVYQLIKSGKGSPHTALKKSQETLKTKITACWGIWKLPAETKTEWTALYRVKLHVK